MTDSEKLFIELAESISGAIKSQMFGSPCVKGSNGKAAFCLYKEDLIFKLDKDSANELLALDGTKVFSPMDGRPMNGWIQVPYHYHSLWKEYGQKSFDFISTLEPNKKKEKKAK